MWDLGARLHRRCTSGKPNPATNVAWVRFRTLRHSWLSSLLQVAFSSLVICFNLIWLSDFKLFEVFPISRRFYLCSAIFEDRTYFIFFKGDVHFDPLNKGNIYLPFVRSTYNRFVCLFLFFSLIWRLFIFASRLGEDGSSPRGDGRPALKYENGPFVVFISVPLSCEPKVCRGDLWSPGLSSTGVCFSKVPRTFWARKASCQIAIRLFWKADLLTCFYCKKN